MAVSCGPDKDVGGEWEGSSGMGHGMGGEVASSLWEPFSSAPIARRGARRSNRKVAGSRPNDVNDFYQFT
jgi:hypothetical protein